jgi:glycosyltransferase involved in cell wall biosynthesis
VSLVDDELNETQFERGNRKMVWAGVKDGVDIVVKALAEMSDPIPFDIYGSVGEELQREIADRGLADLVTCHGTVKNSTVLSVLEDYAFGLCVLPPRQDNVHAYPIKVGEYLANGVIPVMSDFPGMKDMARGAGTYTDPDPADLSKTLDRLAAFDADELRTLSECALERSRQINWIDERHWFAEQAIEIHGE